jgi:hypothetical protein
MITGPNTPGECVKALNEINEELAGLKNQWTEATTEFYQTKADIEILESEILLDTEAAATIRKEQSRATARQTEPDLYRRHHNAKGRMDDIGKAIDILDIMRSDIQSNLRTINATEAH